MYCGLFEAEEDEFQRELSVDDPVALVLFLWRSVLHPKLRPYEAGILQVIDDLFGCETVLAMWRDVSKITDRELDDCGFAKIAGTRLIY